MTARRQNGIPGARAVRYVAVVLLVVAGCSGDDAPAATTTQVPVTTQPAAESTTSMPSPPVEGMIDAAVVYEPGNCAYLGPAVIPRGTKATFEFDDGGHAVDFIVGRVIDGITREEIIEYYETHGGPDTLFRPYFAAELYYYQEGAGLMVVEFRDAGDWNVVCVTPPDLTNKMYLGGVIKVIEG